MMVIQSTVTFADVNSAIITVSTLKALPHCLHYRVKGLCYWLTPEGAIATTTYVEHYLPDAVITVFNKAGDNPWTEVNTTLDVAGEAAEKTIIKSLTGLEAGEGQHSFSDEHEQNTYFKEVDIVGNPALVVIPSAGLLHSTAIPLNPYYQSMLDAGLWRGFPTIPASLAEETYALGANIIHHVGSGLIYWGGIYPHEGKVNASNSVKAAAVIAQRSADLINSTYSMPGHIYQSLPNKCGQECSAASVKENSTHTQFQMIYPNNEAECDYFGKTLNYGDDLDKKAKGAYVWILWRFYQGCVDGPGKYIGKTITH